MNIKKIDYIHNITREKDFKHNIMYFVSKTIQCYIYDFLKYNDEQLQTYMETCFEQHFEIIMNDLVCDIYLKIIGNDNTSLNEKLERLFYYYKNAELNHNANAKVTRNYFNYKYGRHPAFYDDVEYFDYYDHFNEGTVFPFVDNLFNQPNNLK